MKYTIQEPDLVMSTSLLLSSLLLYLPFYLCTLKPKRLYLVELSIALPLSESKICGRAAAKVVLLPAKAILSLSPPPSGVAGDIVDVGADGAALSQCHLTFFSLPLML